MYRDNTYLMFHDRVNFSMQHAAVGDTITSLPAVIEARRRNPHHDLHVWVGDYVEELVRLLLAPYGKFTVVPGSQVLTASGKTHDGRTRVHTKHKSAPKLSSTGPVVMNAVAHDTHTRLKTDMVAYGFHTLLDMEPPDVPSMNYPTAPLGPRTIDGDYVTMQAGYTALNRAFPAAVMQPILRWCLDHNLRPVVLGKALNKMPVIIGDKSKMMETSTQSDYDAVDPAIRAECLDMRDKTTLVQARDIIGHSRTLFGVDGGLLHVGLTTEVPVIYGLTNTAMHCRIAVRHDEPGWKWTPIVARNLACQGCQSNWTLVYGHDFRTCYYKDYACTTGLDPREFIAAIEDYTK